MCSSSGASISPVAMSTRRLQIQTKKSEAAMRTSPMNTLSSIRPRTGRAMDRSPCMTCRSGIIASGF